MALCTLLKYFFKNRFNNVYDGPSSWAKNRILEIEEKYA